MTSATMTSEFENMTTTDTLPLWNLSTAAEETTSSPFFTTHIPDITTASNCTGDSIPAVWGYISAVVATLFYGSNFAPIKKFETGDGMFFQWVMCSAVMMSGIVIKLIRPDTVFHPIVMIGGLLWETGNICVVPIIKTIGMGLGLCIWGMTNLLSGWATGRFGLFGVKPEKPDNETMNYIGVALAVFSAVVFSFVKNEITPIDSEREEEENQPLLSNNSYGSTSEQLYTATDNQDVLVFNKRRGSSLINEESRNSEDASFIDRLSPGSKRLVGIGLSIFSGLLYGQLFTAATYVQDNYHGASQNGLDYVFTCFCGIYLSSTVYFCIYIIFMKNKPKVYPKAILPGIISGVMWSIATAGWFVANKVLSEPVAFPIVTTIPAVVASIWGVAVFREIRGARNLVILFFGFALVGVGATLAGLSKHPGKKC